VKDGHGQCLTDETLTEYLEGNLEPAFKAASESHLVACERCRDQLVVFMRLLREEVTPEEAGMLQSISTEWDQQHSIPMTPPRRSSSYRRYFVGLVAAVAALVAGVSLWIGINHSAEPKSALEVNQLLLDQNRPFEARMAGQPHQPMLRLRGVEEPGVSYDLLAGQMTQFGADNYEMGRFYLLQKNFAKAIPFLETAAREATAGAAVHNDLGVAYLEAGNSSQVAMAEQEFRSALQQNKAFAAAAFNLALFFERTNATAQAEAQWKQYLAFDAESDWAREARERLRGLSR
jgi:tetratricopeptide (TPR) repeat protein